MTTACHGNMDNYYENFTSSRHTVKVIVNCTFSRRVITPACYTVRLSPCASARALSLGRTTRHMRRKYLEIIYTRFAFNFFCFFSSLDCLRKTTRATVPRTRPTAACRTRDFVHSSVRLWFSYNNDDCDYDGLCYKARGRERGRNKKPSSSTKNLYFE